MSAFIQGFLPAFAANLSALMIQTAGSKAGEKFGKKETQKALERCVKNGIMALLTRSADCSPDTEHILEDFFNDFFRNETVGRELSKMLRGKQPDREELLYLFEEAGYDSNRLPGLDFETAMHAFAAAFTESAIAEPELSPVIQAGNLTEQTGIQEKMLAEIRDLVAFLRDENHRITGIHAGTVQAENMVSGQQIIYNVVRPEDDSREQAETEEQHYLKTLIRHCDYLDLASIDEMCSADDALRISDVFTALHVKDVQRFPGESIAKALKRKDRPERTKEQENEPVPVQAIEAIGALQRLAVLGHPGGGKSTLVNYICAQLAFRRLGDTRSAKDLPGWKAGENPLPVHIILRQFAAQIPQNTRRGHAGLVWDYLREQLNREGCGLFYDTLSRILKKQGGIIFFDGLDEVIQSEEEPRRVIVKEAVQDFSGTLDKCRIVLTSREYAYHKSHVWRLPSKEFPEIELALFHSEQIESFTRIWYQLIGMRKGLSEEESQKQAEYLSEAVKEFPHLQELAQYPLLLTLMAQVHSVIGYLPENRADLYDRAVNLLLAHWDNRIVRDTQGCSVKKGQIMRLGIRLETLRSALERLAFSAHEKQEKDKDRSLRCADISMSDLLYVLEEDLNSLDKAKTVVEYIHERAGLLHALEEYRVYAFPHRTFQEYLAAVHIKSKSNFHELLRDRIRRDRLWWQEVFLRAAGHSRKFPMYVSAMVSALIPKNPGIPER